jgi:hypothetical protein
VTAFGSIAFTAPAAGNVLALAGGFCNVDPSVAIGVAAGFNTTANVLTTDAWLFETSAPTTITALPFSVSQTIAVAAGSNTIFLNVENVLGTGSNSCSGSITLLFSSVAL